MISKEVERKKREGKESEVHLDDKVVKTSKLKKELGRYGSNNLLQPSYRSETTVCKKKILLCLIASRQHLLLTCLITLSFAALCWQNRKVPRKQCP